MNIFKALLEERTLGATLLAAGIVAGISFPDLCTTLKPFALPGLFMVIIFSLVPFASLPLNNLVTIDRSVCRIVAWQQIVLPCIVMAFGILAKFPIGIVSLMVVTATAGSVFASPAFALLLGLDHRQALQGMVMSTLMTPISLYLGLSILFGSSVELNLEQYLERTAIFLLLPMLIFLAYRPVAQRLARPVFSSVVALSRWLGLAALLVFGLGVMAELPTIAKISPLKLLFYLVIVTTLCSAMLALTTIVMYRFGLVPALTAGVLAAFRNVGLGFALLGETVNHDLDMYVGVSMIPLFMAPIILRVLTARRGDDLPALA